MTRNDLAKTAPCGRKTLLVGSTPYDSEEESMEKTLAVLGETLASLPDGEIGEKTPLYRRGLRRSWVHTAIIHNEQSGAFEVVQEPQRNADGFPASMDERYILKPRYKTDAMLEHLDFGYLKYFMRSYPIFKRLREQTGYSDVRFQVGIPTGLAIGLISMQPPVALRYRKTFDARLAYEVNEMFHIAGDDLIVQVELPVEVSLAATLPGFLIDIPINSIRSLLNRFEANMNVGIHLCLGDMNHKSATKLEPRKMLVALSNRLVERWPEHLALKYIHYPLAEGDLPPTTDPAFYEPFRDLRLPDSVRLVAGFVHEGLSQEDHCSLLSTLERITQRPVDIACSCGLGRRSPAEGEYLIGMMKYLACADR